MYLRIECFKFPTNLVLLQEQKYLLLSKTHRQCSKTFCSCHIVLPIGKGKLSTPFAMKFWSLFIDSLIFYPGNTIEFPHHSRSSFQFLCNWRQGKRQRQFCGKWRASKVFMNTHKEVSKIGRWLFHSMEVILPSVRPFYTVFRITCITKEKLANNSILRSKSEYINYDDLIYFLMK